MMEHSSAEEERLYHLSFNFAIAWQVVGILCFTIVSVATFIVNYIVWKKKVFRELPFRVRFSLVFYAIYMPCVVAFLIFVLTKKSDEAVSIYEEPIYRVFILTLIMAWYFLHWQFT